MSVTLICHPLFAYCTRAREALRAGDLDAARYAILSLTLTDHALLPKKVAARMEQARASQLLSIGNQYLATRGGAAEFRDAI